MTRHDFERVVTQAIDELPAGIRRQIANVAIVVEEWPNEDTLDMAGVDDPADLLGFYYGIPLTARTSSYGLVLPDKISIFRQPIILSCNSETQVLARIKTTVRHELAHYFGITDDRLTELGAY